MKGILGMSTRPIWELTFTFFMPPKMFLYITALFLPPRDFLNIHFIFFSVSQLSVVSGVLEKREVSKGEEGQRWQ